MRYLVITLLVLGGLMWCAQGYAGTIVANPSIQRAHVAPNGLTPQQLKALEAAKAARSPMTKGMVTLVAKPATAVPGKREKNGGITITSKGGLQGGKAPLWGTNTTVYSGDLEWHGAYPEKIVSFDFDSAGNYYATSDSAPSPGNSGQLELLGSNDNGATWYALLTGGGFNTVNQSKIIVVQKDSLFWYWFNVDSTGSAWVIRWNASAGGFNQYTLGTGMTRIAAAWDMDRVVPYFHVALLDNSGQVWYVRGTGQGTVWSAPAMVTTTGVTSLDIATGNMGQVSNSIFMGITWAPDSAAWAIYDSEGTWIAQNVGDQTGQAETEASIAASHGQYLDSIRVYFTYTYAYNPSGNDYDIHESYNMQNGQNAWTTGYWLAGTIDYEHSSSINIPNWGYASGADAFVNVSYYDDYGGTYNVNHDWLTNGYNNPTSWNGPTVVSDFVHSYTVNPYATGTRDNTGSLYSVVLYPGTGPTNIYMNGFWFTGVEQGSANAAPKTGFELAAAQPNPFSHNTNIAFSLPKSGNVNLAVYDIAGRRVATLAKGTLTAGSHEASFNGSGVPAGVYFYRLSFEGKTLTNRMVVVR